MANWLMWNEPEISQLQTTENFISVARNICFSDIYDNNIIKFLGCRRRRSEKMLYTINILAREARQKIFQVFTG